MRRFVFAIVVLIVLASVPINCQESSRIKVVASNSVLASAASEVGGPFADVDYILPDGATPHEYKPTLEDIEKIRQADLIVLANSSFLTLEAEIRDNVPEDAVILDYQDYNVSLMNIPNIGKNFHGYWLYPDNYLAIARAIAEALSSLAPEFSDYFWRNFERLKSEVEKLKQDLLSSAKEVGLFRKKALVTVPAAAYIVSAMGIEVFASIVEAPGKTLSSTVISETKELAERGELAAIFCPESMRDNSLGESSEDLAQYLGVPIVYIRVFSTKGLGYIALMEHNAGLLKNQIANRPRENCTFYIIMIAILAAVSAVEAYVIFRRIKLEEQVVEK